MFKFRRFIDNFKNITQSIYKRKYSKQFNVGTVIAAYVTILGYQQTDDNNEMITITCYIFQ